MLWFQVWAGIATSRQLLAGLALKPKPPPHPKTLDAGGKPLTPLQQGSVCPHISLELNSLRPYRGSVHPALSERSALAVPTNAWCCATAHGHGDKGTPFPCINKVLWENRGAAASLSLASKTLVLFSASFQKSLKQPIFLEQAECKKNSWVYIPITLGTHSVAQGNAKGKRWKRGFLWGPGAKADIRMDDIFITFPVSQ